MAEQEPVQSEDGWTDKIFKAYRSLLSLGDRSVSTEEIREMVRNGTPFNFSDFSVSEASQIRDGLLHLGKFANHKITNIPRLNEKLLSFLRSLLDSRGIEKSRIGVNRNRQAIPKLPYRILTDHSGDLRSAVFSPDEHFLLAGCGNEAMVWETGTGEIKHKWTDHSGAIWSTEFSHDGKYAVVESRSPLKIYGSSGFTHYEYDVSSGKLLFVPTWVAQNDKSAGGTRVNVSNESISIVTWSDGSLLLRERISNKAARLYTPHGGNGNIIHLALSPQSKFLFTASYNLLLLWNLEEVLVEADWQEK
jgi:WD40 repeat protein